ncbi:Gfo/Idh/MocA family protein [Neolewinella agarilytica]|uniref:Gfo/Idh/MocA family protein n=1 Tax=Neolewinella agarilytica TaxID=478744 RepID=UPI0023539B3B|nr:Gfo/Idh/MocA family oxidoreductase [Neolewinella agarilytica]
MMNKNSRRRFLRQTVTAATGLALAPGLVSCGAGNTATASSSVPARAPEKGRKLNVALLGLGSYAKGQIAPSLQFTRHCQLAGIITGSPEKIPEWQAKHDIPDENVYSYDNMDELADNPNIDVVYVITPTATHKEFAVRAAKAGKHVWCEKPMAMTVEDSQAIIDACNENNVRLSIGYRMLHEPNTQDFIALSKEKAFGAFTAATSLAGYAGSDPPTDYWRGQRAMGGGALYDMGVYTVNGLRYGLQMAPVAVVKAMQHRPTEVDVTTEYTLEFPGGLLAEGKTSVVTNYNQLRIEGENGWHEMQPMQPYGGVKGLTSAGTVLGPPIDGKQQTLQMDDDALAIMNNTPVLAPGEMGRDDIAVIRAIIESAETGKRVVL